jgi:hypothetical protein
MTVMWIGHKPTSPYQYSCLVHEITHGALQLLAMRGVHVSSNNDEPLAFLIDHLVLKFLTAIRAKVAKVPEESK